jgi:hypothetical protein
MQQYEQQVLAEVLVIAKGINIHAEHDNIFSYFPLKFPKNSLFYKLCTPKFPVLQFVSVASA